MKKIIILTVIHLSFSLCLWPETAKTQENDIKTLEENLRLEPENYEILKKLGTAYLSIKRNQDAIQLLEREIDGLFLVDTQT